MHDIDLDSLARGYTTACVAALGAWATAKADGSLNAIDPGLKFKAIELLLERGWGRPRQQHDATVKGEIKVTLRQMLNDDDDGG